MNADFVHKLFIQNNQYLNCTQIYQYEKNIVEMRISKTKNFFHSSLILRILVKLTVFKTR